MTRTTVGLALAGVGAALVGAALVGAAFEAPAARAETKLDRCAAWIAGSFSSAAQAARDERYYDVRLEAVPIWTDRDDGPWLYIEQAVASATDRPYRQRVYQLLETADGGITSRIYTFPDAPQFAGAWRDQMPLSSLAPDDLELREGCDVHLQEAASGMFIGATRGSDCSSSLRGASFATSEVFVGPAALRSWDRGFNAASEQVWGAEWGPYVFDRLASPAERRPWVLGAPWGPRAHLQSPEINECSGVARSRRHPNIWWTHNDSGDVPRIFAIDRQGVLRATIGVDDVTHIDWEDMALGPAGRLFVSDAGNNRNARQDLMIYELAEPEGIADTTLAPVRRIAFRYPDQTAFPDPQMNHDSEALFWRSGHLYILTKHRSNTWTRLYRLDPNVDEQVAVLVDSLDVGGMVTAASLSPDGEELAILTYTTLTLIGLPATGERLLSGGPASRILFEAKQSEAICHEGDLIRVVNEQGEIHELRRDAVLAAANVASAGSSGSEDARSAGYLPATHRQRLAAGRAAALALTPNPGARNEAPPADPAFATCRWSSEAIELDVSWRARPAAPESGAEAIEVGLISWGEPGDRVTLGADDRAYVITWSADGFTADPVEEWPQAQPPALELVMEDDGRVRGRVRIPRATIETLGFNLTLFAAEGGEWTWGSAWSTRAPVEPFLWGELELVKGLEQR